MGAINPAIYQEMEISAETTTGEPKTIDLKLGVVKFNYYEDLFSPMKTAMVLVANTGNVIEGQGGKMQSVYNGLPLRGGERMEIKIAGTKYAKIRTQYCATCV